MKKRKNWIKRHPFLFGGILLILVIFLLFVILIIFTAEGTIFSFNYEETGSNVDGKVFLDGEYFGETSGGKIDIPRFEEIPKEITFKGEFEGIAFEFLYDFPEDYLSYSKYEFLVNKVDTNVTLFFYDNLTTCPLNGEVFIGNKSLGRSNEGKFALSRKDYDLYWNTEVGIIGFSDTCFGKDIGLPLAYFWNIKDLKYYFENEETIDFIAEIDLRSPTYPQAMQGFIRPEEVQEKLNEISFKKDNYVMDNVTQIFGHTYMNYVSDLARFGKMDYWQTPSDFIKNKGGDCEDWAIYAASLLRAYDPTLNCYAALWYTHMNVICQIDKTFMIMDQEKVRVAVVLNEDLNLQDNKRNVRSWRNGYFEQFGIAPNERILLYLFNEKELIEFENGQEDFIDWVLERGEIN